MTAPEKIYLTKNLLGELFDGWDALPSDELKDAVKALKGE